MTQEGFKRKLVAILSADVEGYSRLMDDDEEATVRTLTTYRNAITDLTQQFRGRIVDSPGDNVLAEFTSVVDAVNCAVEIQRELAERNTELPYNRKMEFRIGVNLGDVIEEESRIYGDGVNIAARVESMAEAGGICISGRAYDQVANKLGLEYEYLGEHQVKNITTPIRVYRVLSFPGAAAHRVVQAKKTVGRQWRRFVWATAAVSIVAIAAATIWNFYLRPPPVEKASVDQMAYPLPDKPSIAVLPFANISGDPTQDYISDGITEQIITSLSKIPHLLVIARSSVFTYKGKPVKVQQVAEDLGVRYVLEGSVQTSGAKLRIAAQLIDAIKGTHLWSEHYDRHLKDLFDLQDELTSKIITSLQIKLTEGAYARAVGGGTSNLKALEYYWIGEAHMFGLGTAKRDYNVARESFEKALELDPQFATAWAALGFSYWFTMNFKRAAEYAQKALSIDNANAKAHVLLSNLQCTKGDFDQAIEYGKKAIALAPNNHWWHSSLGTILIRAGRHDEAIAQLKEALRLSPLYNGSIYFELGQAYYFLKQHEEGIAALRNCINKPFHIRYTFECHITLTAIYSELGRGEKATHHAEQALKIWPDFSIDAYEHILSQIIPTKNQAERERLKTAWRQAGLK